MKTSEIKIRVANMSDADELLKIYAPYVEETAITFEYEVPSVEEFKNRITQILQKYPYLVAEVDGKAIGYAYANTFKDRQAYDRVVETTVYIAKDQRKKGIGRSLYVALEKILKAQNITNMYACVACTKNEDEYLTNNSVDFHSHIGFKTIGEFHSCGYKFNRWYDMVWMEKIIGEHLCCSKEFVPFPNLD